VLELLEDRLAPAILFINSTADNTTADSFLTRATPATQKG
jgi:hypothetical protein